MAKSKTKPKDDNNLLAAIAHAGIILFAIIIPLIIYLMQKDKSKYVEYQAKQALIYQIAVTAVGFVVGIFFMILTIITLGIGAILYFLLIPFGIAAVVYGLYGAYECFNEREFRYVLIADWMDKK